MQFFSFMKFGLRSLVAETKSLKSSFLTQSSKIIEKSPEFTVETYLIHFCKKIIQILRIAKNYVSRVFLRIMKND